MKEEEDKDNDTSFAVTRYPVMPSQVALQQMKNRLQLAQLGKKLMKWTALASAQELRRIGLELDTLYRDYERATGDAFIALARSRYFYPSLNQMVLENVGTEAGVLVTSSTKVVSGVKVVIITVHKTEEQPYPHLGIGKGGQIILETKKVWLDLLKQLVYIIRLRGIFVMVEAAYKTANKRMNLLAKIVIPRAHLTERYVLTEMEEMEREEFHRLKKIKEKKRMKISIGQPIKKLCPICERDLNHGISIHESEIEIIKDKIRKYVKENEAPEIERLCPICKHELCEKGEEVKPKVSFDKVLPKIPDEPLSCMKPSIYEQKSDEELFQIPCDTCNETKQKSSDISCAHSFDECYLPDEDINKYTYKKGTINVPKEKDVGYFEKKIRKKVIITKILESDGSIREERKTIIYKKEKRDPTKFSFSGSRGNSSSDEFSDMSCNESFDERRSYDKHITYCVIPNRYGAGYIRKTKSTISSKLLPPVPTARHCISLQSFSSQSNESSILPDSDSCCNCFRFQKQK